jgi:two-component system, OmpR family, sensor kinase
VRPAPRRPRSRGSLALRISLLTVAVAVLTAAVAGGLGISLARQANQNSARQLLSRLATEIARNDVTPATRPRVRLGLTALGVNFGTVDTTGRIATGSQLVRDALTQSELSRVLTGGSVSAVRTVDAVRVIVAARHTSSGGVILVQRRADAVAFGEPAIRRLIIALIVAGAIAVVLGLVVAWRMSRPLRQTAAAAHALAAGRRDVSVRPTGPAEVAELADALNVLSANLAHSEARQREFLMSVSHDLRTPLTAISGYAESLADGIVPPDQAPRVGAVMLAESQRLGRLVGDLLDLARLDARDFRVETADVDVSALVEAAAAVWSGRCAGEGIEVRLERPIDPIPIRTDPGRLRQVLDGLLENALRVTPSGAPIVLVARAERIANGQLLAVAEVRDGGPGLTDADLAVAFDRSALYDRYRGVRQVGTGLGLAIVHALVSRLGGTIEAGHAEEGGARFTVRLPFRAMP